MNNLLYPFFSDTIKIQSSSKLLYDVIHQRSIALKKDAWFILDLVNGMRTQDEIYRMVCEEYELSQEEFQHFFTNMSKNKIILFSKDPIVTKLDNIEYCYPEVVSLLLTDKCNIRCIYCYGDFKPNNMHTMPLDRVIELFDVLSSNGTSHIELTGGEPLVHPDFITIFKKACEKFDTVALLSNGILFTDELFKLIQVYIKKVGIRISIDGYHPETNDYIRQVKGTFFKTINTIEQLVAIGARLEVTYMILHANKEELHSFCSHMQGIGVKKVIVSAPENFHGGRSVNFPDETDMSNRSSQYYHDIEHIYKEVVTKYGDLIMSPANKIKIKMGLDMFPNCGAGWKSVSIHANGDIVPCNLMNKTFLLGNIYKKNIQDIFRSNSLSSFLSKVELRINRKECYDCQFKSFCAKCIYKILIANKQLATEGKPLCDIALQNNITHQLLNQIII